MDSFPFHGSSSIFVVISGPSGAGKSTIIRRFLSDHPDFAMSVSCTTRQPRAGECEGVDYFFVSDAEFERRIAAGEFLEYARVFGKHSYGTPKAFINKRFSEGLSVIKDIDIQGAEIIRQNFPGAIFVFVVPPQKTDIEERLRGRSTDSEEVIRRRLVESERELAQWNRYDYLIINDDLDRAVSDLSSIVRGERLKISRLREHAKS